MMSSFVQAQPVIYGPALSGNPSLNGANCYYSVGCNGTQSGLGGTFHGAAATGLDPARCSYGDYDAGGYGQQRNGYGGRYGQLSQQQQQQQQQQSHRMYMSDYRQPDDVYSLYHSSADQPQRRPGPSSLYGGGEELARPAGDSPSAGVVPASSPASSTGLCSRYSPPSVPPTAVPHRLSNPTQPPVIYPWMKMVHSVSGKLPCFHS